LDGTQFTQKQITGLTYSNESTNTNASKVILDQYSNAIAGTAYQKGTYNDGTNTNAYSTQAYTKFELLNGTSTDLHTWAVGDGSVKVTTSNTWNNTPYNNPEEVISWLGDTKADTTASSGMFYSAANAGTLPTTDPTAEALAIAFTASETWDCSGASEATMSVDLAGLAATCDTYGLRPDAEGGWIDCYQAIGD